MGEGGFRNLTVWQKSKDLAIYIYKLTNKGFFNKDFGLRETKFVARQFQCQVI
jgi:hypothetical protein